MKRSCSRKKSHRMNVARDGRFNNTDRVESDIKKETVEEFLARGGKIKEYAYKRPAYWQQTFNGSPPLNKATYNRKNGRTSNSK